MNLEVLISTMNQKNHDLLKKMNINSDAIVINQSDRNQIEEFSYKDCKIKFFSMTERGVGLSRNTALMRATANICLFADDDVVYVDNYKEIICNAFRENPEADVIVFNVESTNPDRKGYVIPSEKRVRFHNCLRYGTFRIAVRTESIRRKNIYFSLLFGGGARYGFGEDCLFMTECIKKGLKIYSNPNNIGFVSHGESTWFKGYNDKFFIDKGVLFATISPNWARALCIQFLVRRNKMFIKDKSIYQAYRLMIKGIKETKARSL